MQKDYCLVEPSDEEYPYLVLLQMGCYLDEEYLELEQLEQQVLLALQEPHQQASLLQLLQS
jgi:hypothetical protein